MPAIGMMKAQPNRMVVVAASTDDFNLKTAAGNPPYQASVICKVNSAVEIGSTSTSTPGWQTGSSWAKGTRLRIVNDGTIAGKGGKGGNAETQPNNEDGSPGGNAVNIEIDTKIDNPGTIGGGGGGGGGGRSNTLYGGGGGGAGAGKTSSVVGTGDTGSSGNGTNGSVGSTTNGGNGGSDGFGDAGGAGGSPGNPGAIPSVTNGGGGGGGMGAAGGNVYGDIPLNGNHGYGGAAGKAVELNGKTLTWQRTGNRYGAYT